MLHQEVVEVPRLITLSRQRYPQPLTQVERNRHQQKRSNRHRNRRKMKLAMQ